MSKVRENVVRRALTSWLALNEELMKLTEAEVETAIKLEESAAQPRATVVKRLRQRLNAMRTNQGVWTSRRVR